MATLQKIRNRGAFLVAIIGFALLAFVLGDLFTSGNTLFMRAKDKAFVVNGDIISTQEYADKIAEWENFQKMVSGQTSLDENTTQQIRDAVYQQMVRERILDHQAKRLGLTVSKAEINDLVHGENISPLLQQLPFFVNNETGMFDKAGLMQFLNMINAPQGSLSPEEQAVADQYKSVWLFIENMIKYQRLEEKYSMLLASAVMVNDVEAKNNFEMSRQSADIAYVTQNYFSIPDSTITVSEQEVKAFYDKNKQVFKLDVPLAKITYFTKDITPSEADYAEIEAQAKEAFQKLSTTQNPTTIVTDYSETPFRDVFLSARSLDNNQKSFVETANISDVKEPFRNGEAFVMYKLIDKKVSPDSVHLRMMAIPESTMMGKDTLVTNFIDSVYNVIQGGKSFAEVANSLNPQSNGADLGWVREMDLISAGSDVVKAVFEAPVGQLQKLRTTGQQIIFQVEEKTAPVQKYKLATINMPVIVSEKTSNNIDNELNQFISEVSNATDKFDKLATEKGYMVNSDARVSANDFTLMRMPGSRQIVSWAVNEKKMGTIRKFDLSRTRVVVRVDEIFPAGIAPMSEVSKVIESRLMNDKKAEKIIADLQAKKLTSLDAYASAIGAVVDTMKFVNFETQNISGAGFEPAINAQAAFAPVNKMNAPTKGNRGVYITNVLNRTENPATYNAESQKIGMQSRNAGRIQRQSMDVLREKLKVVDNRYVFF